MTLYLEVPLEPDTIGYNLADSPTDTAAALKNLSFWGSKTTGFVEEVGRNMRFADPEVATFLRRIADAVGATD